MTQRLVQAITFLCAANLWAQTTDSTWQSVADKYIGELMSGGGDDWMYEEDLNTQLQKAFAVNDDPRIACLLRVPIAEDALAHYEPYERALILLDYSVSGVSSVDLNSETAQLQVLALLESVKRDSSVVYVNALLEFGRLHLGYKNYKEAFAYYNKALLLTEAAFGTGTQLYNDVLLTLSYYYSSIGNMELAVQYKERAEQHASQELEINLPYLSLFDSHAGATENPYTKATDLTRLALLYHYNGSRFYNIFHRALAGFVYEDAARLIQNKESVQYGSLMWNYGLSKLGIDNTTAIEAFREASNIYRKLHRQKSLAVKERINYYDLLNNLGYAYYISRQFDKALAVYEELFMVFKGTPLQTGEWYNSLVHNLILTHHQSGNHQQLTNMLEPYTGDNATWHTKDSKGQMDKYGDLLYKSGDYAAALRVYTRAYDQYWTEEEFAYQLEQERMSPEELEFMGNMSDMNDNLLEIGADYVAYAVHKYKPVGETYNRLLFKMAQSAFLAGEYPLSRKYILAYINEFYTQLEILHLNLQRGADLYEIYRLQEQLFPAYDLFQSILMNSVPENQEEHAENNKLGYLHLLDSKANIQYQYRHMRQAIENGTDEKLKQAYEKYQEQRNKLAQLRLTGYADQEEIDALIISVDTLKQYMSEQTSLLSSPTKTFVFWTDIKQSLKKDEAAVEIKRFIPFGGSADNPIYAAYIITAKSEYPEVIFLKNGDFLEGRGLKRYQNSIQLQLEDESSYSDYWKSIHEKLQGAHVVYVSADGVYNQINLNTLFNPVTRNYLIDELTLYNVISTKRILKAERKKSKITKATLMGRPAYYIKDTKNNDSGPFNDDLKRSLTSDQVAAGNINDLPGTEKEISTINSILKKKGVDTEYYLGNDATEELFKRSRADIIHVATHGFWFAENEALPREDAMLNSGLLFAGVKNYYENFETTQLDDGILTAYEVQGMNLDNTQLVVLSACETGLGKIEVGEGVYGLQRALSIAGVDNLIMSLWKVDDTATQELFTAFYTQWVNGKRTIIPAFQKAQQKLKARYKHPYYWGAFKVIN